MIVEDSPATASSMAVLLDIGLPGRDGFETARRLREQAGLGSALLVAVSGFGQSEDRQHPREAGIDHHLTKPIELETLHELLAAHSRRRPAEKSG